MRASLRFLLILLLAISLGWFTIAQASQPAGQVQLDPPPNIDIQLVPLINSDLSVPIQITNAGDGSRRLFIVEQSGRIKIWDNGSLLATPFLNISSLVSYGGERGLLGLAFHPDYSSNGYFYLNYTRAGDGATVIVRYRVSQANPDIADPGSASIILTISQPYSNHNGGQLLFGPDGYLYIGMGDGGSGGDPQNYAQNINSLLGKMLRISVDVPNGYANPPSNPFVGQAGADEIWALGLRNPWRFSFDRLNGDLYIGDVGQNTWEEVSYQAAGTPGGVNFGWRCREGAHTYTTQGECSNAAFLATLTDPIAEYSHTVGQSITGGFVYRGLQYANLYGRYFYADFVQGKIWSMYKTDAGGWSSPQQELDTPWLLSSFGEDEAGELYVLSHNPGAVYRIVDANYQPPDLTSSTFTANPATALPGQNTTLTLTLNNNGGSSLQTYHGEFTIPAGLSYIPGSFSATNGMVDASNVPVLTWQGDLSVNPITISFSASVDSGASGTPVTSAQISGPDITPLDYLAGVQVEAPLLNPTALDLILPGTQPNQLHDTIPLAEGCDVCHSASIFDNWRGSLMSQAGRDPLMWAALNAAEGRAPGVGEYCIRCHVPKGWLEGRSQPSNGNNLLSADLEAGVTCEVCHRLVNPVPSADDLAIDVAARAILSQLPPADHPGNAMLVVDPDDNRRGPFDLGTGFPYHSAYAVPFLGADRSLDPANIYVRASLCGSCHNVDNPLLSWDAQRGQYWPNPQNQAPASVEQGDLFPIETTFSEWALSEYAQGGVFAPQFAGARPDGMVATCQDCHMPATTGFAADENYDPVLRDCQEDGCLPQHTLAGVNTWTPQLLLDSRWRLNSLPDETYIQTNLLATRALLRKSATLSITIESNQGQDEAVVRITNQTGHKLPTGYPEGRRMWLHVRGYNLNNQLIFESGRYDPLTLVIEDDPDLEIFEALQGITPELAAELGIPAGPSFEFILNNTVIKDNRIPPRGYTEAAFNQPGLRPIDASYADGQYWSDVRFSLPNGVVRVEVVLYHQVASQEYIDFLRTRGGADGFVLGLMYDDLPSPPEMITSALYLDPSVYTSRIFLGQVFR